MKILFLDIDGVVCLHEKDVVNWGEDAADDIFDDGCCLRLKQILDATGCKLVLSSSWRLYQKDVQNMLAQFKPFGITRKDFIGVTPLLKRRSDEIMTFAETHSEIDIFVAVDDEDFSDARFPAEKLVLTEQERGITEDVKCEIIKKLGTK
jgi:hypothetical protein